jgi:hypothetical protein
MADSKKPTGMLMDGVFSSEAIDSSGEVVSLKGMDTSYMEEGYGVANYEHLDEDKGGFGREIVGKIVFVHKIFKDSDCQNERQRMYWRELKEIPFLYGIVRLYDGAGHPGPSPWPPRSATPRPTRNRSSSATASRGRR